MYNGVRGGGSERPLRYGRLWRSTGQRCREGRRWRWRPGAAAVRISVPTLPGSWTPSSTSTRARVGRGERHRASAWASSAMARMPCGVSVSRGALEFRGRDVGDLTSRATRARSRSALPRGFVESCGDVSAPTIASGELRELFARRARLRRRTTRCDRALCDGGGRGLTSGVAKFYVGPVGWNVSCLLDGRAISERSKHETYTDRVGVRSDGIGVRDLDAAGSADGDRVRAADQRAASHRQRSGNRPLHQRARRLDRQARGRPQSRLAVLRRELRRR